MEDPVAVALERRPQAALLLFILAQATARLVRAHGKRRERLLFVLADLPLECVRHPSNHFRHQWSFQWHWWMPGSRAPSQRPHSLAAKAKSLGKSEGGLWRRVIAGQAPPNVAGRATSSRLLTGT